MNILNFENLPEFGKQAVEKRFTDEEQGYEFELGCTYEWHLDDYCKHDIEIDFNDWLQINFGDDLEYVEIDC